MLYPTMSVYAGFVLNPMILLLLALTAARIIILFTQDKITEPIREAVIRWSGADGWATFGWHCVWCQGIWWSAILTATTYAFIPVEPTPANIWLGVLAFFGVSYAGSFLADR